MRTIVTMAAMAWPAGALAQADAPRPGFTGGYAGPEAGLHEHHVYLEQAATAASPAQARYYRGWGVGGGAFGGYDLAVTPRIRIGVEAGVSLGGVGPKAYFPQGSYYIARPRYGLRATGRAGYLVTSRLMAYGSFGYGAHRYRLRTSGDIANVDEWGSSFTIGGGVDYRIGARVGVRLDFRHLDNQMSHLLIGVPIRF